MPGAKTVQLQKVKFSQVQAAPITKKIIFKTLLKKRLVNHESLEAGDDGSKIEVKCLYRSMVLNLN